MSGATFTTNPFSLQKLLERCESGDLKLPDFQRSWVWDDRRIRSLIASISQAFPVGALMTLKSGGEQFTPRPVQGAPPAAEKATESELLLDGQQRMTSLYQALLRQAPVDKTSSYFYFDMRATLDPTVDREEAIRPMPADRILRRDFGREIVIDLSSPEREYASLYFPVNKVFDWDTWQEGFWEYWSEDKEKRDFFKSFKTKVVRSFTEYQVPVISLDRSTTNEAVCLVFEKVNTGGKVLDAFELVTAMFGGKGFKLREDWFGGPGKTGRASRLHHAGLLPQAGGPGVLSNLAPTDFLQGIALLDSLHQRASARTEGVSADRLPPVSATKSTLLKLTVDGYKTHADRLEAGFRSAAKFLNTKRIYRAFDLPYQSQIVPLAVILAELGDKWEHEGPRRAVSAWYWNGVFGELYGSAVESRFARDVVEVPAWLQGGPEPGTVTEASVRAGRVRELRTRLSASYKGVNALLMMCGAKDFRSGQDYIDTVFFDENVDIHHIFPRSWCEKKHLSANDYDSIVNKTPLSAKTNRILGGDAPSIYLRRLETSPPLIAQANLDAYVATHRIDSVRLRADDFDGFFSARLEALLSLIEDATGRKAYRDVSGSHHAESLLRGGALSSIHLAAGVPDEEEGSPEIEGADAVEAETA